MTIAALGVPVLAVVIFEIVLNAASMFSHSNIKIPLLGERLLRTIIVTPDMHRIHHSIVEGEKYIARIAPADKNITLIDPDNRLLVDSNFDGIPNLAVLSVFSERRLG